MYFNYNLDEFKKINSNLRLLSQSKYTTYLNKGSIDEDTDEREDLVIDFKISNMTVINDIALIKKHFDNENLYVNKNATKISVCNILLKKELNSERKDSKAFITNTNNNYTQKYSNLTNTNYKISKQSNINKSIIENNHTNFSVHNITLLDIDSRDFGLLTHYFLNQNETIKQKLCGDCLSQIEVLRFLQKEIKSIKNDIYRFVNITSSKQDLVAKLSDQINKLNIIKINIYDIQPTLDLMKKINCTNSGDNEKIYSITVKKAAGLVESLQNSIRKSNLNANFLIIS